MHFDEALKLEKDGKSVNYKTWIYKYSDGKMDSQVVTASVAEELIKDGWSMSPAEVYGKDNIEKSAEKAKVKPEAFADAMEETAVNMNRIENIEHIEDLETLGIIAERFENKDGKPLDEVVNLKVKGKRTIQHVQKDLLKELRKIGIRPDDGANTH